MEKKDTLHFKDLTKEQRELSCSIINNFGSGQHPVADDNTIDGFTISYLKEIIAKKKFIAAESNLSELGKKTLAEIRAKL
jgi:hypothetical protein